MTRQLLVFRHGKAEHTFGVPDLSRTLTKRGQRQSSYVGTQARLAGYVPAAVVVSPSVRTRETWAAAATTWEVSPAVVEDPRLYDNLLTNLLEVIREADPAARTLLLVGHNPSCELLADHLGSGTLEDGFQTGMLAVFELEGEWTDIDHPRAKLLATVRGE